MCPLDCKSLQKLSIGTISNKLLGSSRHFYYPGISCTSYMVREGLVTINKAVYLQKTFSKRPKKLKIKFSAVSCSSLSARCIYTFFKGGKPSYIRIIARYTSLFYSCTCIRENIRFVYKCTCTFSLKSLLL